MKTGVHRFVELARRWHGRARPRLPSRLSDADANAGMHPQDDVEAALGKAYNKWLVERFCRKTIVSRA